MDEQTVRKTFKYKLNPTPEQEQAIEFVLRRCCELYNAALQERRAAWQKCGVSVTLAGQSAQLPDVNAVRPDYQGIHSQVLQDVLTRLDRAFQVFFRRIREGQTPGYPRFRGAARYNSFTYKQFGNGAALDNGFLVLSHGGDAQDRHYLAGSRRMVRRLLLCRGTGAATPANGPRNRHRHGTGVVRNALS
jgi:putative transposase